MIAAVIPARNEALTLTKVIESLSLVPVDIIIPVLNGTTDESLDIIRELKGNQVYPVCFPEPLGFDVPRAIGAKVALDLKAQTVVFIDGDMSGDIWLNIRQLVEGVTQKGLDLALTDCYPDSQTRNISPLATEVLDVRRGLNIELSLSHIKAATPSHGPHAISRNLLEQTPLELFAVPPTLLANAAQKGLKVGIGTSVPHSALGSPLKDSIHSNLIADTIIGDSMEALNLFKKLPRYRCWKNKKYIGYNCFRRWDLLRKFLDDKINTNCT